MAKQKEAVKFNPAPVLQSGGKPKPGTQDEDDDEAEDIEELRKSGFLAEGNGASPLTKGKPKLEAKAGDKRIKRTITFAGLDGSKQTRTIVYTDKDKVRRPSKIHRHLDRHLGLTYSDQRKAHHGRQAVLIGAIATNIWQDWSRASEI